MIRMLSWVAAHPDTSPALPAALWLERFSARLREAQAAAEARGGRVPEIAALVPLGGRGPQPDDSRPDAASQVEVAIPPGMVSAADMLPAFGAFANAMVQDVIAASAAKGKPISCRAGCTACCHELLIVSSLEARRIAALVEAMPEPRRSEVRARFAEAERRIADWDRAAEFEQGLAQGSWKDGGLPAAWFGLKIPCPLLEGGSCSIYEERPLVCREHMVTSPAENCARSDDPSVQIDVLPSALTYLALRHLAPPSSTDESQGIPLVRALRWAAAHPAPPGPLLPAQIWLNRFFDRLHNVKRYGYAVESVVDDMDMVKSG
jgi:Fe-S-cluster containining protein